jgi:hypothetical protein
MNCLFITARRVLIKVRKEEGWELEIRLGGYNNDLDYVYVRLNFQTLSQLLSLES